MTERYCNVYSAFPATPSPAIARLAAMAATRRADFKRDDVHLTLAHYLWWKAGRPRWFISRRMYELLVDCSVEDTSIVNVHVPHDVMFFCFERGIEFQGIPLRTVGLSYIRSGRDLRWLYELRMDEVITSMLLRECLWTLDTGCVPAVDATGDDAIPEGPPSYDAALPYAGLTLTQSRLHAQCASGNQNDPNRTTAENDAQEHSIKVCFAALLYHAARPEAICIPRLDADERKIHDYKGQGVENVYKILTPEVKWIQRVAPDLCTPAYTVKPHFRGWVLRTLRHQRYKRKPDGSCQVILVPPCAIHPELMPAH